MGEYQAHFADASGQVIAANAGGSGNSIGEQNIPTGAWNGDEDPGEPSAREAVLTWLPWVLVNAVVIVWTYYNQRATKWPGINGQIELAGGTKPIAIVCAFQPLGTGTVILLAALLGVLAMAEQYLNPGIIPHEPGGRDSRIRRDGASA